MSYKTNPIANRIKFNKGWKTSYLPTKTLNYARDISLWFKVYLLLKLFLNLKKIQLIFCEIRLDTQNQKVIYLLINRKGKENKKKRKNTNTALKNLLNRVQTPLFKKNNAGAKFLLYKSLIATKQMSFWNQNGALKKTLSSSWLTKPKTTFWLNTLQKISFVRQKAFKVKNFSEKKNFVFVNQLKSSISTKKQKQILTAIAKIKKKNQVLYGKLISILPQSQAPIFKKLISNVKISILNNTVQIQKLKKFYTFLLLATPSRSVKKKKQSGKIVARINQKKFRFLWKILKKKMNLFHRTRFLKKEFPFFLLQFRKKSQGNFIKKNSLLKKILYLNFLKALFLNQSFLLKNHFFDKRFNLKNQLHKKTKRKEVTFPTPNKNLHFRIFLKNHFLTKKKNQTLKQNPYFNFYYQSYIWLLFRKKKTQKRRKFRWKKIQRNLKFQIKKKSVKKYKKFLNQSKFLHFPLKKAKVQQLKFLRRSVKKQNLAAYYKYRRPYRKNYLNFVQLNTNFRLKYLIQDFLQKYFSVHMEAKIAHALDFYKNQSYFRLAFPIRKKKINQLLKKHRSAQWNQKKLFLASRLELGTAIKNKKKNPNPKTIILTKTLTKEQVFNLSEKKRLKRRLSNDFRRMSQNRDFRLSFKYIIPTVMDFSRALEPQLLADALAKLIQKARKQTWMLNSIRLLLGLLPLPRSVGYKIVLTGRINSKNKTRSIYITKKQIALQIFSTKMNFAYAQVRARIGTFGLKIWVYSRKN